MPQLTESTAEKLSPELATELVRILDLEACWNALLKEKVEKDRQADLPRRQKAHAVFQSAWREFAMKYPKIPLSEPTQNMPDRIAVWCGVLRAVFQRAVGVSPVQVMAKVYRFADRIAAKMSVEPVARTTTEDLVGAVRELDIVIAWCNRLVKPPAPLDILLKARRGEAT